MAKHPHPLTILISVILLAGRQHGLGVLMHDCSHHAFFKSVKLNQFIGEWFCAAPILSDFKSYRNTHLTHHKKTGTIDDPDLGNYKNYPVSKASLKRKIFRDLTFRTGIKMLGFIFFQRKDTMNSSSEKNDLIKPIIFHLGLFTLLTALGYPLLYLLWWISFLTFYMLFLRIRQIAEHASTPNLSNPDPRMNTRTTFANFLERLTVAPNFVNYHLEHHILIQIPPYHLKKLHEILKEKSCYTEVIFGKSYFQILKLASTN